MFKGTERRDARAIAASLESLGGHLDAFTAREQVCYYARALAEHLPEVVDVLADIVCRSRFAPAEVEREKSVVREEIFSCEDNPEDKVSELLAEQVWGGHALGRPDPRHARTRSDALDRARAARLLPQPLPRRPPGGRGGRRARARARWPSSSPAHFAPPDGPALPLSRRAAGVRARRCGTRRATTCSSSTSRSARAGLRVRRPRALPAGRAQHAARRRHELAAVPERARGGRARLLGLLGARLPPRRRAAHDPPRRVARARPRGAARGAARSSSGCATTGRARRRSPPRAAQLKGSVVHGPGERLEPHVHLAHEELYSRPLHAARGAGRARPRGDARARSSRRRARVPGAAALRAGGPGPGDGRAAHRAPTGRSTDDARAERGAPGRSKPGRRRGAAATRVPARGRGAAPGRTPKPLIDSRMGAGHSARHSGRALRAPELQPRQGMSHHSPRYRMRLFSARQCLSPLGPLAAAVGARAGRARRARRRRDRQPPGGARHRARHRARHHARHVGHRQLDRGPAAG